MEEHKPDKILEIGLGSGVNARKMIDLAGNCTYFCFDDLSTAAMGSYDELREMPNTKFYIGDTIETLPKSADSLPKMDVIFIDGGHDYETVKNDRECCKKLMREETACFFHDYEGFGVRGYFSLISLKSITDTAASSEATANVIDNSHASETNPPMRAPMIPPTDHIQIVCKVCPVTHLSDGTISEIKVVEPVIRGDHANGASNENIKKSRKGFEVKTKSKKSKLYIAAEKMSNGFLAPILSDSFPTRRKTGISRMAGNVKVRPMSMGEAPEESR